MSRIPGSEFSISRAQRNFEWIQFCNLVLSGDKSISEEATFRNSSVFRSLEPLSLALFQFGVARGAFWNSNLRSRLEAMWTLRNSIPLFLTSIRDLGSSSDSGDRNPGSPQPLTVSTSNARNTKSQHFRWDSRTHSAPRDSIDDYQRTCYRG